MRKLTIEGVLEKQNLQQIIKQQIDVLSSDLLVISEEFCEWEDSKRRIDLLAIDRDANIVVIELKRNKDGSYMDLQAIRYAAMVSTLTFEKTVDVFSHFMANNEIDENAREVLLDFLNWDEPNDNQFGIDVRIILISADFGKELTTSVMWLNQHDMDITCVRMIPYRIDEKLIVDVEQVIPLPEAKDYVVQVKQKQQKVKDAKEGLHDRKKFDICLGGTGHQNLPKRQTMYFLVKFLCGKGVSPEEIVTTTGYRPNHFFRKVDGEVSSSEFTKNLKRIAAEGGQKFDKIRYFCKDDELIHFNGNTYTLWNQWGMSFYGVIQKMLEKYSNYDIDLASRE